MLPRKTLFRSLCVLFLLLYAGQGLAAEKFFFEYVKGDKFRYISTVDEYVYVNRRLLGRMEIVNRISFSIEDVKDGSGYLKGIFQTSERPQGSGDTYLLTTDYVSEYWRSRLGVYDIAEGFYMPVVRNVPVFPDRELSPGDTWTAPGEERHDFRRPFGIPAPYRIPFDAVYTYLGPKSYEGKEYPAFKVNYTIFFQPPAPSKYSLTYPVQIMGSSDQVLYWNQESGQPEYYTERFKIIIELANGTTQEFGGTAQAKVIEAQLMDRTKVESDVLAEVKRLGIEDASVRQDERGVTIALENIKFLADSAVLLDSEKAKLDKIAQILKSYPDRDLLVTGHTALAGTEEARQTLSEERAKAVADYLFSLGLKTAEQMTVRGMGAREPLADNSTEAGMSRNRRVEITILEN